MKVLTDPNNIWGQVVSNKYLNKCVLFEVKKSVSISTMEIHSGSPLVVEERHLRGSW